MQEENEEIFETMKCKQCIKLKQKPPNKIMPSDINDLASFEVGSKFQHVIDLIANDESSWLIFSSYVTGLLLLQKILISKYSNILFGRPVKLYAGIIWYFFLMI